MKLNYSPKSREDLQNIKVSIIAEFDDIGLAGRVLKAIAVAARDLEVFPYKGASISQVSDVQTDYRYLFCKKNYIIYRIEKEQIYIIRILNEKQNYMRILFGISDVTE